MIQSWGDIAGIILILAFILYNIFANLIPVLRKKERKIKGEKSFGRFLISFYIFGLLIGVIGRGFGIFSFIDPILPTFILAIICSIIWGVAKGLIWIINKIKSKQNKESEK